MNLKKKRKNQHIPHQSPPVHHSYSTPLGRDGDAIKATMSGYQPWIWRRMVVMDTHQQDAIDVTDDLFQVASAKLVVVVMEERWWWLVGIIWVFVFYFFGFWFILGNWNDEKLKIRFELNRCTYGKYLLVEHGVEQEIWDRRFGLHN